MVFWIVRDIGWLSCLGEVEGWIILMLGSLIWNEWVVEVWGVCICLSG